MTRKHNYVTGYLIEGACVYGKSSTGSRVRDEFTLANPVTLWQAKAMLKDLHGSPKAIFKLVPIKKVD